MKKEAKGSKFCPRCGTPAHMGDAYCMRCGHSFSRKKSKKLNLKTVIIIIAVFVIGWVAIRIFMKQPIIPQEFINLFKNMTANKTG